MDVCQIQKNAPIGCLRKVASMNKDGPSLRPPPVPGNMQRVFCRPESRCLEDQSGGEERDIRVQAHKSYQESQALLPSRDANRVPESGSHFPKISQGQGRLGLGRR